MENQGQSNSVKNGKRFQDAVGGLLPPDSVKGKAAWAGYRYHDFKDSKPVEGSKLIRWDHHSPSENKYYECKSFKRESIGNMRDQLTVVWHNAKANPGLNIVLITNDAPDLLRVVRWLRLPEQQLKNFTVKVVETL